MSRAKKRKPTDQAKHLRRAQLKTERERAKAVAAAPLFAQDAVQGLRTAEENYWRTRFMVAGIVEGQGYQRFHEIVQELLLKHLASQTLPAEVFARMEASRWIGYPLVFWFDVLTTTKKVVLRYEALDEGTREVQWSNGSVSTVQRRRVIEAETWPPDGWQPPYTAEQLKKRLSVPLPDDPDDGGLYERLRQLMKGATP